MFGWFSWKKESKKIRDDTKIGFEFVKKDISSLTGWIKHLDSEKELHKQEIGEIKEVLSTIKEDIEELKIKVENVDGSGKGVKSDIDPHKVCSLEADIKRLKSDYTD